ncbi:MAG TPA: immunoglobulin domain-containing protein [Verrucomicrobiota bacterium]|nr:immunoglobulin domain-containing protein [Verrucomicrobiota bacterium]
MFKLFPALARPLRFRLLFCVPVLLCGLGAWAQTPEFRALWVDAFGAGFKDASQVTQLITDARAGNFNAVIVEVRKRGDAYYNGSPYEPKATDVSPASFDPLQDLITKGHDTSGGKARIEIHAWIVTYPISQTASPPPNHPMSLHPDWLTQNNAGETYDGANYVFDPGHPGVQAHTYNVAMDIISRYDVDGFNLDYIRYSGKAWGYNPVAVQRFNTLYNRSGLPSTTDSVWLQFRRDQVTALVRKIYLSALALKPQVRISADTICFAPGVTTDSAWYSSAAAYTDKLQDWRAWMEEGILDLNIPMMYFDQDTWASAWNNWSVFAKNHRYNRQVALGPALYLNSIDDSILQIRSSRELTPAGYRADGVSGYAYKLTNDEGVPRATFLAALTQPSPYDPITPPVFGTAVSPPEMTWKTAPTRGHLKGYVRDAATLAGLDYATVILSGPVSRTLRTDATGFFGTVDLLPGTYTLTAGFPGYLTRSSNVTVTVGAVTTQDFELEQSAAPAIVHQPQSQSIVVGGDAVFSVTATGNPPPGYQWRFNGADIAGASGRIYTRTNVTPADAGVYTVRVANSAGSVTSSNAVLSVVTSDSPPLLTTYPQSQTVTAGASVTLTAAAQGTGPLSYQWKFNGANLAGATLPSLILDNVQTANAGSYTVSVTNNAGSDTSSPATLTVHYALNLAVSGAGAVSKSPDLPTYPPGSSVTLTPTTSQFFSGWSGDAGGAANPLVITMNGNKSVTASFTNERIVESRQPDGSLTPNPPYADVSFANSTLKSGAAGLSGSGSRYGFSGTPSFTIRPTLSVPGGTYTVYVTHGSASSISDDIVVNISQTGCSGLPASTSAFQESNGNTWELLGTMTLNAGVTVPTITFAYGGGTLNSTSGRMYSDAVKFVSTATPSQPPVVLMQPANRTVLAGQPAAFAVNATGSGSLSYQWRFNGANIAGATASIYTRTAAQPSHAGLYSVVVSSSFGSVISSNAMLTVNQPVTITSQPLSQTHNQGAAVTFSVTAAGSAPLGYQWRFKGAPLAGATASSLTLNNLQASDAGEYAVVVTNVAGAVLSSNAILAVRLPPVIVAHPADQTVNPGATVVFAVSATGTEPLSYQWQRGGSDIVGATGSSFSLDNVQPADSGIYSVIVSNAAGVEVSDPAVLTVNVPPGIVTQPQSQTVNAGDTVTFTVEAGGTEPLSYQWRFNGADLEGATSSAFVIADVREIHGGAYSVVVSNVAGVAVSADALLTVAGVLRPRIDSIRLLPGGQIELGFSGGPGSFVLEASSSLGSWTNLSSLTATGAVFEFVDGETNPPTRFYRLRKE